MTSHSTIIALIHGSTLSTEEQDALISALPKMSPEQLSDLEKVLQNDQKEQEKIFAQAETKQQETLLQMKVEMEKIKIAK